MSLAARASALALACLCLTSPARAGETELRPDEGLRVRPIAGETRVFVVPLEAETFAHVEVGQGGAEASVTVVAPGGDVVAQVDDTTSEGGLELISWIAGPAGRYRVEVHVASVVTRGFFDVHLDPPRPRAPDDDARIQVERDLISSMASVTSPILSAHAEAQIWRTAAEARRLGDLRTEARAVMALGCSMPDRQRAIEVVLDAAEYAWTTGDLSFELALTCTAAQLAYLGYLDESIEVQRAMLARRQADDEPFLEVESLTNLGGHLLARGDTSEARELLGRARELALEMGDRHGAAVALTQLSRVHMETGAYQEALEGFTTTIEMHRELRSPGQVAGAQASLADAYYELGDLPAAVAAADEVIEQIEQQLTAGAVLLALRTRGLARLEQGATAQGLRDLQRGVALARTSGAGYLPAALNRLGHAELQTGRLTLARRHHAEALQVAEATRRWNDHAEALLGLCAVEEKVGRLETAHAVCAQALDAVTRISLDRGRVAALYRLARVARRRGHLPEARTFLEQAIEVIDGRRYRLKRADLRESYLGTLRDIEDEYVDVLVGLAERDPGTARATAAFEASEQRRARSLRELLASAPHQLVEGVDPALLAEDRLLRDRLRRALLRQVGLTTGQADTAAVPVSREVTRLTAALEDVASRIRATSPRYAALTQPQPTRLADIQRDVVDDGSVLLFYALGERRSFLWVVSPADLKRFTLPGRVVLEAAVTRLHRAVAARADTSVPLGSLSRLLLRPVAAELGGKRLLVIADGALLYVPFAAIPDPRGGGPVVRRNEVVHLPSAATVLALRNAPREPPARTVAVLADPVFSADDARVASRGRDGEGRAVAAAIGGPLARALGDAGQQGLWRLRGTRREAAAIRSLVRPEDSRFALDFDASRATALASDMASYRFLHFATHGVINSARPELSGLVLSLVDPLGRPQEGLLTSLDTFNLRLSADLVVLSGCRTALGKQVRGEGIVGLARGLMHAGARGVLASLWPVDDRATARLMGVFYEGMLGPARLDPAAALRQSQLAVMKDPRWSSPYYWAAFQLQGDWKTTAPPGKAR
jgi:CHAT domain-containing protein/tetratricopeptide (TPR) repeat protein